MIQMDNLIELTEGIAPPQLYRYNRFVAATVSAGLAEGKTIGEGLDAMDAIAAEVLDDTFRTALTGESKEYRESSSSLMFAFILALVLIYLILAAQFESFKDPFVIMLTVPLAVGGALLFMHFNGQTLNIYSQIGIIMLIGLVAKNGILIVEFANQKQEAGIDKLTAINKLYSNDVVTLCFSGGYLVFNCSLSNLIVVCGGACVTAVKTQIFLAVRIIIVDLQS